MWPNQTAKLSTTPTTAAVTPVMTPLVEPISIDEAFLDVSDLPDPAEVIARRLQARIDEDLHLPSSLGVASNKLVAKIANNIGKARHKAPTPPRAILVVPPGEEAAFLAPLPLKELWGVGPKTEERTAPDGLPLHWGYCPRGGEDAGRAVWQARARPVDARAGAR